MVVPPWVNSHCYHKLSSSGHTINDKQRTPKDDAGTASAPSTETNSKREIRILVEKYFYQLLEGCPNKQCKNVNCKSSGQVPVLTPNEAAAKALQLFFQGARLCEGDIRPCDKRPSALEDSATAAANGNNGDPEESSSDRNERTGKPSRRDEAPEEDEEENGNDEEPTSDARPRRWSRSTKSEETIDEPAIMSSFSECLCDETAFAKLVHRLGIAFSTVENISGNFAVREKAPVDHILDKASHLQFGEGSTLTKEQLRTLEDDKDKDEDSCAEKVPAVPELHKTRIDFPSMRRTLRKLLEIGDPGRRQRIVDTLNSVLLTVVECMSFDLQCTSSDETIEHILMTCLVILDLFCLSRNDFKDALLIGVCETMAHMSVNVQARAAWILSVHSVEHFKALLELLQELISCQVMSTAEFDGDDNIEDNGTILHAVKTMKILYYANILAGDHEVSKTVKEEEEEAFDPRFLGLEFEDDEEQFLGTSQDSLLEDKLKLFTKDQLATELGVSVMDSRRPVIPFAEFCNEVLSEALEMDQDYLNYYNLRRMVPVDGDVEGSDMRYSKTSFMLYPFILTTVKKTLAMYFHSRIRMYSESRISVWNNHFTGQPINPHLKLRVRRDHLIEDALIELEMIAVNSPKDLKKQLVVEFVGEQGIDEGGVSKEFFQLIVEQIFNPEYGMFAHHDDTEVFWFNALSFENDAQFSLIGIVLGLAIYNNIVLAVNFPMVVYRKLMGLKGSFADLEDWKPNLHQSLTKMLEDNESDFEDVYMQPFEISYKDVFDNLVSHELKENGATIMVTQETKQEFVELYADFLLNKNIEKQFRAFRKGFQMVMAESPLNMLFRPEELELLVCGSKQFDVSQLHKATEYENGYTADSQIIKDFWEIVYEMPVELQKKLLEFSTGSARVPIGGLSNLKLIIARHGSDSERLPTSHTCYNILLLPEYDSKEKLKDRLLKAISFSQGFGLL